MSLLTLINMDITVKAICYLPLKNHLQNLSLTGSSEKSDHLPESETLTLFATAGDCSRKSPSNPAKLAYEISEYMPENPLLSKPG